MNNPPAVDNEERRRIMEMHEIRNTFKWMAISAAENRLSLLLAAIVFAFFIPDFWLRHGDRFFLIALVCATAAYGIGRLAAWAIKGFYE
jgi:hypothetical protein